MVVYDNEPRNKDIATNMKKAVNSGMRICVLPERYAELGKDVNSMISKLIENGSTLTDSKAYIKRVIDENTYRGMAALLQINGWKK